MLRLCFGNVAQSYLLFYFILFFCWYQGSGHLSHPSTVPGRQQRQDATVHVRERSQHRLPAGSPATPGGTPGPQQQQRRAPWWTALAPPRSQAHRRGGDERRRRSCLLRRYMHLTRFYFFFLINNDSTPHPTTPFHFPPTEDLARALTALTSIILGFPWFID